MTCFIDFLYIHGHCLDEWFVFIWRNVYIISKHRFCVHSLKRKSSLIWFGLKHHNWIHPSDGIRIILFFFFFFVFFLDQIDPNLSSKFWKTQRAGLIQIKCKIWPHNLILFGIPLLPLKNPFPIRDPKSHWTTFEKLGPGLWITSLADHSMCTCGTVCQMQWSATLGPHKGLSSLLSSSPFTPQTSATRQSLAIFRSFLMTLLLLDVSAKVRRLDTGLWWTTLSHGVSWTTCSWTQQRPKSWWWIWGEPRSPLFSEEAPLL